jgi:hypothetical protein
VPIEILVEPTAVSEMQRVVDNQQRLARRMKLDAKLNSGSADQTFRLQIVKHCRRGVRRTDWISHEKGTSRSRLTTSNPKVPTRLGIGKASLEGDRAFVIIDRC